MVISLIATIGPCFAGVVGQDPSGRGNPDFFPILSYHSASIFFFWMEEKKVREKGGEKKAVRLRGEDYHRTFSFSHTHRNIFFFLGENYYTIFTLEMCQFSAARVGLHGKKKP